MKRDTRRGKGQWRGCYSFKNIVDRNEHGTFYQAPKRSGGLKMGHTYYYYYEIDGSTEVHDLAQPSTNTCPYLPGQTVNTLTVPFEQRLRQRSASTSSIHPESFMTMDPETRFESPTPAPVLSSSIRRLGSASSLVQTHPLSRQNSSSPSWKRFFSRRLAAWDQGLHCSSTNNSPSCLSLVTNQGGTNSRPQSAAGRRRNRDISPTSLRRLLAQDMVPLVDIKGVNTLSAVDVADELACAGEAEDDEDEDEDFVSLEDSDAHTYGTTLSPPPPFPRSTSSGTSSRGLGNSSTLTLTINTAVVRNDAGQPHPLETARISALPQDEATDSCVARSYWSPATTEFSVLEAPKSPSSLVDETNSFYESNDDDEDDSFWSIDGANRSYLATGSGVTADPSRAFVGYSLPRHIEEGKEMENHSPRISSLHSPPLAPRRGPDVAITNSNLLGTSIDMGLDDFASELGTIVNLIANVSR